VKTHLDRSLAAAKAARPESFGRATLRILKAATSRSFHNLFHGT
jgi:hypothetical protein